MTNEELLEQLKEISSLMANDDIIAENDNNIELNNLTDQKEVIERQISELEHKLSDDSNYPLHDHLLNLTKLNKIKKHTV